MIIKIMTVNFKDTFKEGELLELIDEARKLIDKTSSGLKLSGFQNINRYDIIHEYILELLKKSSNFFEILEEKRYAQPIKGHHISSVISKLLNAVKNHPTVSLNLVKKELENLIDNISERKLKEFEFIYPINIDFLIPKYQTKFKLNKLQFFINKYSYCNVKYFSLIPEKEKSLNLNPNLSKYFYVRCKAKGRNYTFALDETYKQLSHYISILNYCVSTGISWNFGLSDFKDSDIELPHSVFIFENQKFIAKLFNKKNEPAKVVKIDSSKESQYRYFITVFNKIRKLNNESFAKSVIIDSFTIYNSAITEEQGSFAFFKYWSGLEQLTFKHKYMSHYKMIQRVKNILVNPNKLLLKRIDLLHKKRNRLVHNSDMDTISRNDVTLIKNLFKIVLQFLILYCDKYKKKEELEFVFDNLGKNKTILQRDKRVISYILKIKK